MAFDPLKEELQSAARYGQRATAKFVTKLGFNAMAENCVFVFLTSDLTTLNTELQLSGKSKRTVREAQQESGMLFWDLILGYQSF